MSKFIKCKLAQVVKIFNGATPNTQKNNFFDGDISWITPKDLSSQQKKYITRGERSISKLGYDSCSTKLLPIGTILMSSRAPIGLLAITEKELCTNQGFKNLVADSDKIDNEYLYYYLIKNVEQIKSLGGGTTFSEVSKQDIGNFKINIHSSLQEQKKIASVLSSLDAKIELNNRIIAELEAMAKQLYDYWFVQFDFPNAEGKPYRSSGGKMVYNEKLKREIPEGWEVKSLLKIANFTNGVACQNNRPLLGDKGLRVIKIREMHTGFTDDSELVKSDIPEKVKVFNGDILFSWSASLEVMIWAYGDGGLNQHIFKVTSDKYPRSFYYFQLLNYIEHFKKIADARKTTMGHITQEHLAQSTIVVPSNNCLIQSLEEKINPFLNKIILLQQENQELTNHRDWLLPMLMNGQAKVK